MERNEAGTSAVKIAGWFDSLHGQKVFNRLSSKKDSKNHNILIIKDREIQNHESEGIHV